MSVVLNGSTQYLHYSPGAGALVTYPFTVAVWFNPDNVTATFSASNIQAIGYDDRNIIQCRGSVAGDYISAATYEHGVSGWALAYSSSGYSASTWQHAMAVFYSNTDRRIYLDGGSKGTDSTDRNGASHSLNMFQVGARDGTSSPAGFFDGKLAHFTVWNTDLTDADAVSLAGGTNPLLIENGDIVQYNILNDDNSAEVGASLTEVASPSYDSEDNPVVNEATVDAVATIAGTGSLSGTAEVITYIDAEGTIAGTGAISGTAVVVIDVVGTIAGTGSITATARPTVSSLVGKRRLVVAGSNVIYYE